MYAAILLSLLSFVVCCHGKESMDTHVILDKYAMSLEKRSDGLMAELVNLLVKQGHERKNLMKRCKVAEERIQNLTKALNVTELSVDQLRKKMTRQYTETKKQVDATTRTIKNLDSYTKQRSSQIDRMQKQIENIQKTKGLFGKKNGIGFSVRFKKYGHELFSKGNVVKFDTIISNLGNGFNTTSGKFTCYTPGLYFFQLTVVSSTNWAYAWIVKNKSEINIALSTLDVELHNSKNKNNINKKTRYESGSTSAMLELKAGDQVWVKSSSLGDTISYEWHSCFSGVLISE